MFKYICMCIALIVLTGLYIKKKNKKDMSILELILTASCLGIILFSRVEITPMVILNPYLLVFVTIIGFVIYRKIYKSIRNVSYKIEAYEDLQMLNRDIEVRYNPSITSFIVDGTINIKDIAADIMNLYAKKIINIDKQIIDNKVRYKLTLNDNKKEYTEIFVSDRYIINTIILKKYKFNFDSWKAIVEDTFLNLGFCNKQENKFDIKFLFIKVLIVFLVSILPMWLYLKEIIFAIIFSLIVASISIVPFILFSEFKNSKMLKRVKLNKIGKEEAKKWIKFKKFIKEYTLLKEKNIEDIIIYEKYVPYAVALKVNLNYEETIYSAFNQKEIKEILQDITSQGVFENYL